MTEHRSLAAQFIYGALKLPIKRLLLLLHQGLSLLGRKSSTSRFLLRYTTNNLVSFRLHFTLQRISPYVARSFVTVSTAHLVKVLFVYRTNPPPLQTSLSAILDKNQATESHYNTLLMLHMFLRWQRRQGFVCPLLL